MARGVRPWGLALALVGSLLLHVIFLGGLSGVLPRLDQPPLPPPFDVNLVAPPSVVAEQPATKTATKAVAKPPVVQPPPAPPIAAPVVEPTISPPAIDSAATVVADPAAAATPAATVEPAPPPLNPLPPRLDLRYRVRYGLVSGSQTWVWINEGERYTLTSVATASGLAGVFYRGQLVQTSRGRITPRGLQPEAFWDQRGDKHSRARFDAALGDLTLLPATGAPRHIAYQGEVQDVLSLFFQLALTAPPPAGPLRFQVFNGKKLRDYTFEVSGEAPLKTALGTLRTLHLTRLGAMDGRFEAWLAIDRYYLPVRVLRSDEDGNELELSLETITP